MQPNKPLEFNDNSNERKVLIIEENAEDLGFAAKERVIEKGDKYKEDNDTLLAELSRYFYIAPCGLGENPQNVLPEPSVPSYIDGFDDALALLITKEGMSPLPTSISFLQMYNVSKTNSEVGRMKASKFVDKIKVINNIANTVMIATFLFDFFLATVGITVILSSLLSLFLPSRVSLYPYCFFLSKKKYQSLTLM